MIILAIETSCDETSIAVLQNQKVLSNITVSQILEQQKYGGVMPSLAAKLHLVHIQEVLRQALATARITPEKIDYIAYTEKPGLIICLQIGKIVAETLSLYLNKPLIKCNHLEAHVYASLLEKDIAWEFPVLALIISGGHTQLYQVNNHGAFSLLGETSDDAIGECLDKSAILLGYSYPGGPIIEQLALTGKNTYQLPLPKNDNSLDFSFSGLKSAVRRLIEKEGEKLNIPDLAYSLQHTLAKILVNKVFKALEQQKFASVVCGGGVVANQFIFSYLKKSLVENFPTVKLFVPEKKYCTDNAAMPELTEKFRETIRLENPASETEITKKETEVEEILKKEISFEESDEDRDKKLKEFQREQLEDLKKIRDKKKGEVEAKIAELIKEVGDVEIEAEKKDDKASKPEKKTGQSESDKKESAPKTPITAIFEEELRALHEKVDKNAAPLPPTLSMNTAMIMKILKRLLAVEEALKRIKTGDDQFNLQKEEFKHIFTESELKADYEANAPTFELLNKALKRWLKPDVVNNPNGYKIYEFGARTLNDDYTPIQWIRGETAILQPQDKTGKKIGSPYNNVFCPANPEEKKTMLGTGTGKSTFYTRCVAFLSHLGLIYEDIASQGKLKTLENIYENVKKDEEGNEVPDKEKKVTVCVFCGGYHTAQFDDKNQPTIDPKTKQQLGKYEIVDNGPNVVLFDEAHTDLPCYRALIDGLLSNKKIRRFKIVQMSATFTDVPTSRRLTGNITDYWLQSKTKVLILNEAVKDYATDIVKSMEAPLVVIASRDYSVGFSFGDVNVISTGASKRKIVVEKDGKWVNSEISDQNSPFDDLLQERGRAARDKDYLAPYVLIGKDVPSKELQTELKKDSVNKISNVLVKKLVNFYSIPEPLPPIKSKDGNRYLNLILIKFIKESLDPDKLFTIVEFTNKLLDFFNPKELTFILIEATKDKIRAISEEYDWYKTPEPDDDYVFNNEKEAREVGFLLQARETPRGYEMESPKVEGGEEMQ
ncbi:5168_t:CDS:10 [Racocetra fulgida]|uniref:N(6)-L-threonylcarbamoyladenine synthase n=1 Tax=Racocetra fulgida TaxID=60492 RepID=A0A9N8ZTV8_9GLOM|nr:5168_t:CDS:10 [Racocetra fulgida]